MMGHVTGFVTDDTRTETGAMGILVLARNSQHAIRNSHFVLPLPRPWKESMI
jgi:hypothetical protein